MEKKDYDKIRLENYLDGKNKELSVWEKLYIKCLGVYPWLDEKEVLLCDA